MIRDDLHPEELLARAAERRLSTEEAADLKAHLARCPACALQLELRAEVGLALAPTDADFDVGARAVQRLLASGAAVTRTAPVARGARRAGARLAARAAAIALMLLVTGAGAAALLYRAREGRFWGAAAPAVPSREKAPARGAFVAAAQPPPDLPSAAPTPEAAPIGVPEAVPVGAMPANDAPTGAAPAVAPASAAAPGVTQPPTLAAAPVGTAPSPLVEAPTTGGTRAVQATRTRATRLREVPAETVEAPAAPPAQPEAPSPTATTDTAQRLFQAAERARRRGESVEADRLYAQLASDFPRSREEIVARALRGQLLLDELGSAAEALASFDAYLRAAPHGALGEEARAGRAEALGRLARRREEAAAWTELLTSYPGSLYAPRARERLAALARE